MAASGILSFLGQKRLIVNRDGSSVADRVRLRAIASASPMATAFASATASAGARVRICILRPPPRPHPVAAKQRARPNDDVRVVRRLRFALHAPPGPSSMPSVKMAISQPVLGDRNQPARCVRPSSA
jgi:hypothetical protein